jgi:hypothetical protein
MAIDGYFVSGYFIGWLLVAIILMVIGAYYWLLY